jgi:transposase-like protein
MVRLLVLWPPCHSDHVSKGGKTQAGQQRSKCQNSGCPHYSLQRVLSSTKDMLRRSKSRAWTGVSMAAGAAIRYRCCR